MDAIKAIMLTNAMCVVPGILGMISRGYENLEVAGKRSWTWHVQCIIDAIAVICQVTALLVWPLIKPHKKTDHPWLLPLSAVLISFGWWENFVDVTSPFEVVKKIAKLKTRLRRTRYWTYTVISLWKMAVFLLMLVVGTKINENSWSIAFDMFNDAFDEHNITVKEVRKS